MNTPDINWEANAVEDSDGNIVSIDDAFREGYEYPIAQRRGLGEYALKVDRSIIEDIFELSDEENGQLTLEMLFETRQDWAWDMRRAFDDYQFADISVGEIASMTNADRKVYALHFQKFWLYLRRDIRLIASSISENGHGDLEIDEHSLSFDEIKTLYGEGHSAEELLDYATRLRLLESGLRLKGIVHVLEEEFHNDYPKASMSPEKIRSILLKDKSKHGDCKIVFDVNPDGARQPRIERIPRVERKLAA